MYNNTKTSSKNTGIYTNPKFTELEKIQKRTIKMQNHKNYDSKIQKLSPIRARFQNARSERRERRNTLSFSRKHFKMLPCTVERSAT